MEILIFALIALYNVHRQPEWVAAEPEEFQSFELKALRHFAGNKPILPSSRSCRGNAKLCGRVPAVIVGAT